MKTYQDGLKDAAKVLTSTAEDMEQSFDRREQEILYARGRDHFAWRYDAAVLVKDREKVQLLKGQAWHILQLGTPA